MTATSFKRIVFANLRAILTACIILFFQNAHAQWVQTQGPFGGVVRSLLYDGSNIYAGTYGAGIFKSSNNGASWTSINTGLGFVNARVLSMAVSGTNLLAGCDSTGLFLSVNNGSSWSKVSGIASKTISGLIVNGGKVYAGAADGLYISSDNGVTWSLLNAGIKGANTLVFNGGKIFAGTASGVFLSTDSGVTWTSVNTGLSDLYVSSLVQMGSYLIAGTHGGVFRSSNNGTTWTSASSGLSNITVSSLVANGSNLFASTSFGINLSTDNGSSWTTINTGLTDSQKSVYSLAFAGSSLFAGTLSGGVVVSTNNGTSWSTINNGLANISVNGMTSNAGTFFAIAGSNRTTITGYEGMFLSTDNGVSWTPSPRTFINPEAISTTNGSIYVCDGGIAMSQDNGITWKVTGDIPMPKVLAASGNNVFVGTFMDGVYLSTDNGTSWNAVNTGLHDNDLFISLIFASGNMVFISTLNGIFVSTNNGSSWTQVSYQLASLSMVGNGNNVFTGTYGGGIYSSTDGGTSWAASNTGLSNKVVPAMAMSGSYVFAGTSDGVYYSTNNGASWNQVGLMNHWIESLYVSNGILYAGTAHQGISYQSLSKFCSIESFTPSGVIGSTVTITGTGFSTVASSNTVIFNGTPAIVTNATSTSLQVTVPSGAKTGPITVSANGGQTATSATNFGVVPNIISLTPSRGIIGTTVTIGGTGFGDIVKNNTVKFNGTLATVSSATETELTVTLPPDATSGPITVSVDGQIGTSSIRFVVIPVIDSFTPQSGIIGSTVTISGSGFSTTASIDSVRFNGVLTKVSSATSTTLSVTVPLRASTGLLTVSTGDGQKSSSSSNFIVIPPTITSFTPTSGVVGTEVTITGTGFSADASIDTIRFNGTWSKVTKATSTTLTVNVPIGAKKGAITVSVGGGETVSSTSGNASQIFCVNPPQPTIKVSGLSSQPTLTSSASSGNQWFLNGVAISGETNQIFAPKTDGVYSVQVTVDGCQGAMSLNEVIVITGDINKKAESVVSLYPNPIESFATINLENLNSGEPVDIQFFNILGDKLLERSSQGGVRLDINISHFSSGTYFVRIIQGRNLYTCKVVKP